MRTFALTSLIVGAGSTLAAASPVAASTTASAAQCSSSATSLHLSDPPYENYFYSDCHSSSQVVVTSPLSNSNLAIIGPRLLVAWPGGNSGALAYFAPQNGVNGTLGISLNNATQALQPVYEANGTGNPIVGVSGVVNFNSSAVLSLAILGSIRTIRDFVEGPSLLQPEIQKATTYTQFNGNGASIRRVWLDNSTVTTFSFVPAGTGNVKVDGDKVTFDAGSYTFSASYNYPQLTQLDTASVLKPEFDQTLVSRYPDQTTSLSFLSYSTKLLAGAWRFLTYFGRDSMISALLLQPVLSEGEGSAIEAVIGSVLERTSRKDGSACHEETIGDYATWLNLKDGIQSTASQCDYKMVDTDYYLPVLMQNYFLNSPVGQGRAKAFLATQATNEFGNGNLTYAQLALIAVERIMKLTAPFAAPGGQTKDNMIHLKENQIVGEWRDSTYGIGGGRIPYDVNTALVPAALRSVAALANAGYFPENENWKTCAVDYANVWEDETLKFFEVKVPQEEAKKLVQDYTSQSNVTAYSGPSNVESITGDVSFYGVALEGNNNQEIVRVMNTDDCFRLFLLNSTNQAQLSSFLSQTADNIMRPFPVGLSSPIGVFVANPAYGGDPVYAVNFTNAAYHGTVVWSWQLAMLGAGLERQLERCSSSSVPDFCHDDALHTKVKNAYNHLWDLIEANNAQLSSEVWSWTWTNNGFQVTPLGALPPPPGNNPTESDIRQLWSLTFLAVTRNENLK
jgi:hypothetical protein